MKRTGLKLTPRLLLMAAAPMIFMFVIAVAGIQSTCESITETMVKHELDTAQYAFEVAVGNIAQGTFLYTNGKFYKGKRNISDNTQFFDNFSNEVDLQVSVFYENIRVATSLVDQNGVRMTGTEADPEIYERVVKQGEDYYSDHVELAGEAYYALYCPLKQYNKDEIIGMTFVGLRKSTVDTIYRSNLIKNLVLLVAIFIAGIVMTLISVQVVVKGIKEVIAKLNRVASGELNITVENKLLRRADEIGDIAVSVDKLVHSLKGIVADIKGASTSLDGISAGFSGSFGRMSDNIGNIDRSVEEMALSSTQQAQDTSDVGNQAQDMGDAIDTTSQNIDMLVRNAEKMREYNEGVDDTIAELIKIGNDTQEAFNVMYQQTNMTNQSAQDIQTAADIITDIADQTSLLSLNASIEAARAGEHGKGFAVVADEIRKLADQSAESASRITGIIEQLIKNSDTTVDTMKNVTEVMDRQGEELAKTKVVFASLNSEIGEVSAAVVNIRGEVEKLNKLKSAVLTAVQSLASIAEENAAATQETSASMQELRQIVSECSSEVDRIINTSRGLADNIGAFTL